MRHRNEFTKGPGTEKRWGVAKCGTVEEKRLEAGRTEVGRAGRRVPVSKDMVSNWRRRHRGRCWAAVGLVLPQMRGEHSRAEARGQTRAFWIRDVCRVSQGWYLRV